MYVKVQRGECIKKIRLEGAATFSQLLKPFVTMNKLESGNEHSYRLAFADDKEQLLIDNDTQLQQLLAKSETSSRSGTIKLRITNRSHASSDRSSEEYEVVPSPEPKKQERNPHANRKLSDCTHQFQRVAYHSQQVRLPAERWFESDHHYNQSMIETEELRLQEIKAQLARLRENVRRLESRTEATDVQSLLDFCLNQH